MKGAILARAFSLELALPFVRGGERVSGIVGVSGDLYPFFLFKGVIFRSNSYANILKLG